jgi:hypothetical protein
MPSCLSGRLSFKLGHRDVTEVFWDLLEEFSPSRNRKTHDASWWLHFTAGSVSGIQLVPWQIEQFLARSRSRRF